MAAKEEVRSKNKVRAAATFIGSEVVRPPVYGQASKIISADEETTFWDFSNGKKMSQLNLSQEPPA